MHNAQIRKFIVKFDSLPVRIFGVFFLDNCFLTRSTFRLQFTTFQKCYVTRENTLSLKTGSFMDTMDTFAQIKKQGYIVFPRNVSISKLPRPRAITSKVTQKMRSNAENGSYNAEVPLKAHRMPR